MKPLPGNAWIIHGFHQWEIESAMIGYDSVIEAKMQRLFATLSEKDKRRYAGIEATKLGHGGIDYISTLFDIDPKTIRRGLRELDLTDDPVSDRVRKKRRRSTNND
jgi:hypothetical protein